VDREGGQDEHAPAPASDQSTPSFRAGAEQPQVEEVTLPPGVSNEVWMEAIRASKTIAVIGMCVGCVVILAGIVLILLGVSGAVTLEISTGNIDSKLQTGVVGVVIALIGLGVIYFSRQKLSTAASTPPEQARG
jgi:hypothetical protein